MRTSNQIRTEVRAILSEFVADYPILGHIPIRVSSRMTRSAGKAIYKRSVPFEIVMSLPYYAESSNEMRNTVTHEAAHIVAGLAAGHGPMWKMIHRSMGGDGLRCGAAKPLAPGFSHRARASRVPVPCAKCGQSISLGPTQARRAQGGVRYTHKRCPR